MNGRRSIVVIVLNWNGKEELLRCLRSLVPALSEGVGVLVVDNGSVDDSVEAVNKEFPGVALLRLRRNVGYAAGNNTGFVRAMKERPDYVVFLNNDTEVGPEVFSRLTDVLATDSSAGIAVPKILYMASPDRIWYAGGVVRLELGMVRHEGIRCIDRGQFDRRRTTGYATGCCFAMRSADFRRLGGFDERFGIYAEDVDLSLRVRDLGLRVVYEPGAVVWHRVSVSSGGPFSVRRMLRRNRAMLRLLRKHRAWSGFVCYPFVLFGQAVSMLFSLLKKTDRHA